MFTDSSDHFRYQHTKFRCGKIGGFLHLEGRKDRFGFWVEGNYSYTSTEDELKGGIDTRVQTAIEMRQIAEPYIRRRALRHLEKERIVIFGAGTGSPYFSTDTAAALRAAEIGADCLLKATKVDGIYNKDPKKNPDATLLHHMTYLDALMKQVEVMDAAAFSLCMENKIPIFVFNILQKGNLIDFLVHDRKIGTIVTTGEEERDNAEKGIQGPEGQDGKGR